MNSLETIVGLISDEIQETESKIAHLKVQIEGHIADMEKLQEARHAIRILHSNPQLNAGEAANAAQDISRAAPVIAVSEPEPELEKPLCHRSGCDNPVTQYLNGTTSKYCCAKCGQMVRNFTYRADHYPNWLVKVYSDDPEHEKYRRFREHAPRA